jgi:hypothetical protein
MGILDLRDAIRNLPTIPVSGFGVKISEQIEIPNPFKAPVRTKVSLISTNGWNVPLDSGPQVIDSGEPIRIPVQASTS